MITWPLKDWRRVFHIAIVIVIGLAADAAGAAMIIVNGTGDSVANDGQCTLREAINSANNNSASGGLSGECAAGEALPTVDVIAFNIPNIPGAGVHTISPTSTLIITQAVKIDGYTQPGSSVNTLAVGDNAVLLIEIVGGSLDGVIQLNGPFSSGDSSGSTIRGLVIDQNSGRSIFVGNGFGNGSNNDTIVGNFLGVDPTGITVTSGNSPLNAVSSTNLVVGGSAPADRNVISALNQQAIFFNQTSLSFIQGNYIGVNAAGTASLGAEEGILLIQGANNDKIGGTAPGEGNVVYGSFHAISIGTSDNTIIQGNFIGTDATGSNGLNPFIGIGIESSSGTVIGGAAAGAGNVISGNQIGIQVGNVSPATIIQGNKIGTDASGLQPVLNNGNGIRITGSNPSGGGVIGGSNLGEGNTIAFSCGAGVDFNQPATNWPVLGNSIYANGYGIALQPSDEPLTNDGGDADTGANNLQNYPVLTSASVNNGTLTFFGTFNSTPNTTFRIEVFAGLDCNRSGFGEGQTFAGSLDVSTDANGNAGLSHTFTGIPAGQTAISATATDPEGNTSEFSMCVGGIGRLFANGFEPSCAN